MKDNLERLEGKRGKKGGTSFPRYSLAHLNQFLSEFASKTHTSTINISQLNAGVFKLGANSPKGKIKSSALKQFGLLEGDYKKAKASELCSNITMSDGETQKKYFQEAFCKVSVFTNALNTFKDSKIEKTKIAQYAVSTLKVHPDMKDEFVKILLESAEIAGICKIDGNQVHFTNLLHPIQSEDKDQNLDEDKDNTEEKNTNSESEIGGLENPEGNLKQPVIKRTGHASNINVNIDVDPSMDPEKLEKLLKLLKNYGAI
jgi:hypothetical protein